MEKERKEEMKIDLYCVVPHCEKLTSEVLEYGSHSCYTANTPYLPLPCKRSPDGAATISDSSHLIAAYYSFINPQEYERRSWPSY